MCNVNTNAMFGEAMPLARWRVTDIHEYLLFQSYYPSKIYYSWINTRTSLVNLSLWTLKRSTLIKASDFCYDLERCPLSSQLRCASLVSYPWPVTLLVFSCHLCHPGLVFFTLFISQILTLSSVLWIKNSDVLSVSFWSDESRLISLKIPTVMRSLLDPAAETASSQIGNHRHQHSAASAAPLFGEAKVRWMEDCRFWELNHRQSGLWSGQVKPTAPK